MSGLGLHGAPFEAVQYQLGGALTLLSTPRVLTMQRALLLTAIAAVLASSCQRDNLCPSNVPGTIATGAGGIQWGGARPIATANLTDVRVQCIPHSAPRPEPRTATPQAGDYYALAVTAGIAVTINDSSRYDAATGYVPLGGNLVFEALSRNNVVLGSSTHYVRLVRSPATQDVSTSIDGLAPDAAALVVTVRARWLYGR